VQIMRIGYPWAAQVMQYYEPANEPPRKPEEAPAEIAVHCPKCNSEEIILQDVFPGQEGPQESFPPKYKWTCDSCGYHWEDDGVVKED